MKNKTIDAVILAYVNVDKSLHKIERIVHNMKNNINYKIEGKNNPDLPAIFRESCDAYTELFSCIDYLQFNLIRLTPYDLVINESFEFIDKAHGKFSNQSPWLTYQEASAVYLLDKDSEHEELFSAIDAVASNCGELSLDAFKVVSKMYTP